MKYCDWNKEENQWLKKERNISFEIIVSCLEEGKMLDIIAHTNSEKYPNQFIFIIEYENYAYLVPFIEDEEKVFLKTIIPSRKATEKYIRR
ncbi:MAG: toxin [Candidatus Marinimicrobia bacterium CG08_land_8_20_14_0_20_45_22]|nr:MAG: toxin [Candidatus Marinimicrobia bacterium CG08_land_8_20_14_0_20_45_22]